MSKERKLLERLLNNWEHPCSGRFGDLFDEVRELLSTPEPTQDEKLIAYWDTQEGKLIPAVPLSSERTCFKVPLVPLYLHPTRPFIRLTDEEILEIVGPYLVHVYLSPKAVGGYTRKLFDTIQDKLEEKNNG